MSTESREGLLAVTSSLLGLSTIAVALRFYARKNQRLRLGPDDAFAVLALIFYIVTAGLVYEHVSIKTMGYAYSELSPVYLAAHMKEMRLLGLAWNEAASCTVVFIKLSAVFFYRRHFCICGTRKIIDIATKCTVVLCIMWGVAYAILPFFQCGLHLDAGWTGPAAVAKYCKPENPYFISLVVTNIVLDLWILILPIPNIMKLKISTSKRFSILFVFLLAFSGFGASVARVVIYLQIITGGAAYSINHDYGRATTKGAYLTMLEAGISVVAVNLPSLWFLITTVAPQKVLHGLRNIRSLASLRSDPSKDLVFGNPPATKDMQVSVYPTSPTTDLYVHRADNVVRPQEVSGVDGLNDEDAV